ncbi:MAG: ABC transporter permease [Clostridiaceae bacterium]|jgi:sodium transport system permease protein|nr:ABC transporter permease [Clostridiaceae bacterium]
MRLKHTITVLKKEVLDIARDKKSLFSNILLPIIIMPVLMLLVGSGTKKFTQEMKENITVALTQESASPEAQEFLKNQIAIHDENIIIKDPVENPEEAVKTGYVKLVVVLDKDFQIKYERNEPFSIKILFDDSKSSSGGSVSVLERAIEKFNNVTTNKRLEEMGIDPEILTAVVQEKVNMTEGSPGNMILSMLLPMLIAMLVAVGGIPAATDLVAGEKERMTLEPLLTTRASRLSILLGKYFTINIFTFVSVLSTLAGFVISYIINPETITMGMGNVGGVKLQPAAVLLTLAVIVLMGMTFSGIQLAISTFARSFKEGQTYLSMLIFAVMIPSYASMMMQANDIKMYMFSVPVLNTISSLKMILGGVFDYSKLFLALGTSVLYVVLALYLSVLMFKKESVLFRS